VRRSRHLSPGSRRHLVRREAIDDQTTRLRGSTGNPYWYAERLVRLPAPFRVLGGVELRHTTRALGERMLAAADLSAKPA
jgi:hypothetical protein